MHMREDAGRWAGRGILAQLLVWRLKATPVRAGWQRALFPAVIPHSCRQALRATSLPVAVTWPQNASRQVSA